MTEYLNFFLTKKKDNEAENKVFKTKDQGPLMDAEE